MPKVKLTRDIKQERIEYRRNLIESKAHFRGYRTQSALAEALGKDAGWLSRRIRGAASWELDDLAALDKTLKFEANEFAQLVRCK